MNAQLDGKISMAELRAFYPALAAVAETGLKNPLDPDEAAWLDGPSFARWLARNGLKPQNKLGESVARKVRRWREGDAVNLGSADSILVELGHNLNDLPAWCWRGRLKRPHRPIPLMVKREVLAARRKGVRTKELVERYGVSAQSVQRWVRDAKRNAA